MQAARCGSLLGILALVVTGCSTGAKQAQTAQDVGKATQQQLAEIREEWSTAAESEKVRVGWIESFRDPLLSALVLEAQRNNRELAIAAANVDRAWALARRAGSALLPDASLTALAPRTGSSDLASTQILGGTVSWEFDLWGRLKSGQRAAVANAQAVEADLRSAQESLAAATARAYFTAIETTILADIAAEAAGILEETVRIVNARYDNGMASAQDISLARSDLATAREQLAAVEGSHRDAIRALEAILGRYPGAELEVREALPNAPPPPPAGLPSQLLERRPDIVAAERRVAGAFNATAQARAARLPTISLTATAGGASDSLSDLLDPGNTFWSVGANLLAPIFDGGTRRAAVEIATAEQNQALAAYGQAAIDAFREVETNLDQGVVIAQRIGELKQAVSEAENAFRIAQLRYQEGEEDLLSVLVIQRRVNTARRSLSIMERLLLEQRVNLNLALGGGWQARINE